MEDEEEKVPLQGQRDNVPGGDVQTLYSHSFSHSTHSLLSSASASSAPPVRSVRALALVCLVMAAMFFVVCFGCREGALLVPPLREGVRWTMSGLEEVALTSSTNPSPPQFSVVIPPTLADPHLGDPVRTAPSGSTSSSNSSNGKPSTVQEYSEGVDEFWQGSEIIEQCRAVVHGRPRVTHEAQDRLISRNHEASSTAFIKPPPDFSTAYLLLAHDNDTLTSLTQLLNRIYDPRDSFFVHVDAKADSHHFSALQAVVQECHYNVKLAEKRIDVKWGTFGVVQATLDLLQAALDYDRAEARQWETAIILDGSAWPLMNRPARQEWLVQDGLDANSFIEGAISDVCTDAFEPWKCTRTPARCVDGECTSMDVTPNGGLVYSGQQWVRLSRAAANYTLNDPVARKWQDFFRPTDIPDEHFFPSVIIGASRQNMTFPVSQRTHMYTDWTGDCKSYLSPHPPGWSPCYLGPADSDRLRTVIKQTYPFARKFYSHDIALKKALLEDGSV